jgi:O-antigen biosynthesis alpha-1,3-rhamnosyltransferase
MKLAFSFLCENPNRRTGLTTLFHEFLYHSIRLFPDLPWVLFAGPNQDIGLEDPRLKFIRDFPAGDRLMPRLLADHFRVGSRAQAEGAKALLTVGFAPIRCPLPVVMHVNSLQHLNPVNRVGGMRERYRSFILNYGIGRANLIITNSQSARTQLLQAYPQATPKVIMSYEGTQPQFQPVKKPGEEQRLQEQFGFGPGYILWVSNFYRYKQAPLLFEAYAQLPESIRTRMPIVMVGGDWEGGLDEAKAVVWQLGLQSQVRFLGWVADEWLPALYRNALAFCLPSREETFGRCVTEAMSCGTPCLLNDIPIMREVTGGHAIIVDFADRPKVTAGLKQLFEDGSLQQRLREEGIEQAAKFSFENLTRQRISAVLDLLGKPSCS